ncbi:hypothetical protein [Haloprofundus salilacus]|uniref:hypothetical protein n=1 Tax=Haloprofundus salilacus TaxID=2876190 RepID=UPI001CCEDF0B|nr:hypothetical protein [Haloprofundus salilacus]
MKRRDLLYLGGGALAAGASGTYVLNINTNGDVSASTNDSAANGTKSSANETSIVDGVTATATATPEPSFSATILYNACDEVDVTADSYTTVMLVHVDGESTIHQGDYSGSEAFATDGGAVIETTIVQNSEGGEHERPNTDLDACTVTPTPESTATATSTPVETFAPTSTPEPTTTSTPTPTPSPTPDPSRRVDDESENNAPPLQLGRDVVRDRVHRPERQPVRR